MTPNAYIIFYRRLGKKCIIDYPHYPDYVMLEKVPTYCVTFDCYLTMIM